MGECKKSIFYVLSSPLDSGKHIWYLTQSLHFFLWNPFHLAGYLPGLNENTEIQNKITSADINYSNIKASFSNMNFCMSLKIYWG